DSSAAFDPTLANVPRETVRNSGSRHLPRRAFFGPVPHVTMGGRNEEQRMRLAMISSAVIAAASAIVLGVWSHGRAAPSSVPRLVQDERPLAAADVDVELVLAVDVSYSMDPDEQALQREGYVAALTSPEFLDALRHGIHGRIAVTYFEWAGASDQKMVVPWRLIDGATSAQAFADEIAHAPYRRAYRTSISGALAFAAPLFGAGGHRGLRRVIDV